jgi:hypothetical protein
MIAMSDQSRECQAGTVLEDLNAEPDLIEAVAWPFQIAAAMRGAAPATNSIMNSSHAGDSWRGEVIVMVGLTFAWGVVGALLLLATLSLHPGT